MPIFNEVTSFLVSPDAVRKALAAEVFPARLVERLDKNVAVAQMNDRLHVFRWSSKNGSMTVLYYEIDVDVPGALQEILDGSDDFKGTKADVTDAEAAEALARLTHLEATASDARFQPMQAAIAPGYAPIGLRGLFIASLLLGIGGVFVAAINWNRMGYPRRFLPTVVLGTVLYSIFAVLAWDFAATVTASTLLQAAVALPLGAVFGLILVRWQRPAFDRWVARYGPPAPKDQHVGCGFTFLLIVMSLISLGVVSFAFIRLSGRSLENLTSRQVTVSGVSLTYPATWSTGDEQIADALNCHDALLSECVLVLSGADRYLVIQRYRQLTPMNAVIDSAFAMTAMRMSGASVGKAVGIRVGDRPALRQTATTWMGTEQAAIDLIYVQETPTSYVFIVGLSMATEGGTIDPSIDKIVNSIGFGGSAST